MKGESSKLAVVIVSMAAILIAIIAISALQKPSRPGELAFSVENADAGTVPLGQAVVQRYQMRNVGEGPVTITKKQAAALEGC